MNTTIMETTEHGEVPIDVYQKLANDRILFVCDQITDKVASDIIATLMLKDLEDSNQKITLFLNSQGGDIRNVLMICDMMSLIQAPIETICIGAAMDESILLLSSGHLGMRFATRNSIIAISQLVHNHIEQANLTDAKNYLELSLADNRRMMEILAKNTNKPIKQVMEDFDRRVFMTPIQAVKYGLIDKVVNLKN